MNINIVIINIGALGDNLLATPFIAAARLAFPENKITLITSPSGHKALKTNPNINEFLTIDYKKSGILEKIKLAQKIKNLKPGIVFNLTEKIWGYIWAYFSGAKVTAGFTPGVSQPVKSLLIAPLINRKVVFLNDLKKSPDLHEVERYFLLLKAIGIEKEAGCLEVYCVEKGGSKGQAPQNLQSVSADYNFCEARPNNKIIIHLTQKWFQGGWTKEDFVELVKGISAERKESSIIISYGIQEKDWAGDVINNVRVESYFIEDILAFAEELKNAKLLISPDTGIVHLAAAAGAPVVDIFEEEFFEHNSIRWHPWKTKYILVKKNKDKIGVRLQVVKIAKQILQLGA